MTGIPTIEDDDRASERMKAVSEAWPRGERERRDFMAIPKAFPPEMAAWRKDLVARIVDHRVVLSNSSGYAPLAQIREGVDLGLAHLREVTRILELLYRTPRLDNKSDPVDELVYIILARKTREEAYQPVYAALKARFGTWDEILRVPFGALRRLVASSGLGAKKAESLVGAMSALRERFGRCTLEPATDWSDRDLEAFLCSLPEVGRKSAYCIMMYSFGRSVFPVDTHVGRCLGRIGIYRELGLSLNGLDHKQLQHVLPDLIPPNLRYSLHVNLVAHGRAVCRSRSPLCNQCELKKLCAHHRRDEASKRRTAPAPTVVDMFCGAGGLSEGFSQAGFKVLLALDNDAPALRSYSLNHPAVPDEAIVRADVRELRPGRLRSLVRRKRVDVLIGAPPCQGFSHAGFRSRTSKVEYHARHDRRNYLFEYLLAAAMELRPRLFLMENVPGMQSARSENISFLEHAATLLGEEGFSTQIWRLNAASFGVPQDRIRFFLVASSTGTLPQPPAEEYQDLQRASYDVDALPPVTLSEALLGLPALEAGDGTGAESWEPPHGPLSGRYRRYLTKFDICKQSHILFNHAARRHNTRDLELFALLRPGEDSVHAVERHGRGDLMRYRRDVFDDKYARLRPDKPCRTIVSHLAKDGNSYIHPEQVRAITVREAARVQSFPDDYVFCGSVSDQWIQVGNAVPPVLAQAIAHTFCEALGRATAT